MTTARKNVRAERERAARISEAIRTISAVLLTVAPSSFPLAACSEAVDARTIRDAVHQVRAFMKAMQTALPPGTVIK